VAEFRAVVTEIRLDSYAVGEGGRREQIWQVALDATEFSAESATGVLMATARSGAVLEAVVERVMVDHAGVVWHFVRKPLVEGTAVAGRVDRHRPQADKLVE
jgi:alanyl-tRNA synthetase